MHLKGLTMCVFGIILVFAARGGGDGVGATISAILVIIGAIFAIIAAINKSQNAVWRNGYPYCPSCGRQISLKYSRPYCRSCGHNLVQTLHRPEQEPVIPGNAELLAKEADRKTRVREQKALEEQLREVREQHEREAEAIRVAAEAARAEREAIRQARINANGGYTDLQLIGFGVGIILIPLSIAGLLVYLANR
ncbi:MAG: hypothetical protein ACLP7Q_00735 [Isosphaeraceae bacterium]